MVTARQKDIVGDLGPNAGHLSVGVLHTQSCSISESWWPLKPWCFQATVLTEPPTSRPTYHEVRRMHSRVTGRVILKPMAETSMLPEMRGKTDPESDTAKFGWLSAFSFKRLFDGKMAIPLPQLQSFLDHQGLIFCSHMNNHVSVTLLINILLYFEK